MREKTSVKTDWKEEREVIEGYLRVEGPKLRSPMPSSATVAGEESPRGIVGDSWRHQICERAMSKFGYSNGLKSLLRHRYEDGKPLSEYRIFGRPRPDGGISSYPAELKAHGLSEQQIKEFLVARLLLAIRKEISHWRSLHPAAVEDTARRLQEAS